MNAAASAALCSAALALTSFCSAQAPHTYASDFGFQLSYPADWSVVNLGPILPPEKLSLDEQSNTDSFRRSIECTQNLISARAGEPRSTFILGVITADCMGTAPDLDAFSRRTMTTLERRYQLGKTEFGGFAIQGHKFWLMRTTGSEHQHPEQTETIEYLATVLPKGLVFVSGHSLTSQAQAGFEHTHLRMGAIDTELVPAGALDAKQTPTENIARLGSASTTANLIPYDTKASHHFDIGAGFTYEVPADFNIYNTEKWEESLNDQSTAPQPPRQTCHARWLVAGPEDGTRQVIVTTYPQKCLEFSAIPENLVILSARETIGLAKNYVIHNAEYATFTAGSHSFAVMRCTAQNKNRAWESDRNLAIVITPISNGLAEFFLMGRSRAALDALVATTLKLDDGAQTALVPSDAFDHPVQPPAEASSAATTAGGYDAGNSVSHHFESSLGFSIEVPQDLAIKNADKIVTDFKAAASSQNLTPREQTSIQCSQLILLAGSRGLSSIISINAQAQTCIGFPLNTDTLPQLGQSGILELSKRYVFSSPQTGRIALGSHRLWVMRSAIKPVNPTDTHRFLAVVLIPTREGVAECLMASDTQAGLDALMAIPLKFDDGAETVLIPASAFAGSR